MTTKRKPKSLRCARRRRSWTPSPCRQHSLVITLVVGIAAGCSLSNFDRLPCSSNEDCVETFGIASVCGADGYCSDVVEASCAETEDCLAKFGFGSVCSPDRLCVDVEPAERCTRTVPSDLFTDLEAHRDYLVFGALHDATASSTHRGREVGIEAAVDIVNGGSAFVDPAGKTRKIGVVLCDLLADDPENPEDYKGDELARPDAAVATADWLANTLGVPGYIGPSSSGDSQRVFIEVTAPADGRVVQVSNAAASPALTPLDNTSPTDDSPGLLWRTSSSGASQGVILAEDFFARTDVNGLPRRTSNIVALIHEEGSFGAGVADSFAQRYTELAGSDSFERFIFPDGDREKQADQVGTVSARLDEFGAVLMAGQVADSKAFLAQAAADSNFLAAQDLPVYFPQTGISKSIFEDAAPIDTSLFDQVRSANPAVDTSSVVFTTFRAAFQRIDSREPSTISHTAQSYDALFVMALGAVWAITQEDALTGVNMAKGFRKMVPLGGGTAQMVQFDQSGWGNGFTAFRNRERIDVLGASGPMDYDLTTEEKPTSLELIEGNAEQEFSVVRACAATPPGEPTDCAPAAPDEL